MIVVGAVGGEGFCVAGRMFRGSDVEMVDSSIDRGVGGSFGRSEGVVDIIPWRRLNVQTLSLCLQLTQGPAGFSMMHRTFLARHKLQALETRFLIVFVGCIFPQLSQ